MKQVRKCENRISLGPRLNRNERESLNFKTLQVLKKGHRFLRLHHFYISVARYITSPMFDNYKPLNDYTPSISIAVRIEKDTVLVCNSIITPITVAGERKCNA